MMQQPRYLCCIRLQEAKQVARVIVARIAAQHGSFNSICQWFPWLKHESVL